MTLNQVKARIQTIALAHEQINSFGFGLFGDFLDTEINYPACFMDLPTETLSGQLGAGAERRLTVNLYFFDRMIVGGGTQDNSFNRDEVLSDMRSVATDIFSQLRYQKFDPQWNVLPDANMEYFVERNEDYCAGVRLTVTISFRFVVDRCNLPSTLQLS